MYPVLYIESPTKGLRVSINNQYTTHTYMNTYSVHMYVKMRSTNNASSHDERTCRHHGYCCILINKHKDYQATRGGMIGCAGLLTDPLQEEPRTTYHVPSHRVLCLSPCSRMHLCSIHRNLNLHRKLTSRVRSKKWQATSPEPSSLFFSVWPH